MEITPPILTQILNRNSSIRFMADTALATISWSFGCGLGLAKKKTCVNKTYPIFVDSVSHDNLYQMKLFIEGESREHGKRC